MKKFLLCAPQNFAVNYEINDWMNNHIGSVNPHSALMQWNSLLNNLVRLGNQVEVMRDQPKEVPDLVFTANAGLVIGNHVLLAHFACAERRPEELLYEQAFQRLNMTVDRRCVDEKVFFEGAGDCLLHSATKTLVLAYGFRTEQRAMEIVESFVNHAEIQVLQVELTNSSFYHLDTCFCPLDNGYVLWHKNAFSELSQQKMIERFGDKLVDVQIEDAMNFACNSVSVGSSVLMNKCSTSLKNKLSSCGLTVVEVPLSQFMLAGGSAKCLTLEVPL